MNQINRTLNKRHTDVERIALQDARDKITKLEGEAKVLRILLGKCVDVIETIMDDASDDYGQLLSLQIDCTQAMKVML